VAQARFATGDPDRAADAARRAAEALHAGDRELELASLALLSRILIHAHRGSETDAKGLLSRTAQLATDLGDGLALADALREMGFVMILEGNYGAADPLLARSIRMATRLGDVRRSTQALVYRALGQSDRCDYQAASASFEAAIEAFATGGEPTWQGYAEGLFARMLLQAGDVAAGRDLARVASQRIRAVGWTAVLPWPVLVEAECDLRAGDVVAAVDRFDEALTLSVEVGDPCCEGLALRGLALTRMQTGDRAAAIELLEAALATARRFGGGYARATADILADLVEIQGATDGAVVDDACLLSATGPMPDIATRLRRWRPVRAQTLPQTASA
jgi:tetratricopeptide (TPR) repeat protein